MFSSFYIVLLLFSFVSCSILGTEYDKIVGKYSLPIGEYPVVHNYMISATDGVLLSTDVWFFKSWDENPTPRGTVLIRSPYPRIEQEVALPFLAAGFAVVQQDMRGMHYSKGSFDFWMMSGSDGYQTMKWISQQSWSNGNIFTFGISADANAAMTDIISNPPWLKAQFSMLGTGDGHLTCFQGGAYRESLISGWLGVIQREEYVKNVLQNENFGSWWYNLTISRNYQKIHFPSVQYAGWYDIFLQPQIDAWMGFQQNKEKNGNSHLFITPHGHCQFAWDVLPFPDAYTTVPFSTAIDMFHDHDTTKKNLASIDNNSTIQALNIYVMAPREQNPEGVGNYWSSLDDFPIPNKLTYFLNPGNKLTVNSPSSSNASVTYQYNPKNPVPSEGGNNLLISCGPRDQQYIDDKREDVILFTSEPLQENLAITGRPKVTLFVSTNREDTDFTVKLLDVYPEYGYSILVQDNIMRMKFRNSKSTPEKVIPGQVYKIEVDLWTTSYVFPKGHRIRIAVSSSNTPRFKKHINRFMPISEWDSVEPLIADNTIYFSSQYSSFLTLPKVSLSQLPKNPNIGSSKMQFV